MSLQLIVNGSPREFGGLEDGAPLTQLVEAMALKPDRVAIERNGKIVSRQSWAEVSLAGGDKLEIVHFVGGGIGPSGISHRPEEILLKFVTAQGMLAAC